MSDQKEQRHPRNYSAMGEYLKELRIKANLTQREVSLKLGYSSAQFISNFERGRSMPPLKRLRQMQELYGASQRRLIELAIEGDRIVLAMALQAKTRRSPEKNQ